MESVRSLFDLNTDVMLTMADIADKFADDEMDAVRTALSRLAKDDTIERVRDGVYIKRSRPSGQISAWGRPAQ